MYIFYGSVGICGPVRICGSVKICGSVVIMSYQNWQLCVCQKLWTVKNIRSIQCKQCLSAKIRGAEDKVTAFEDNGDAEQ